MSCVFSSSGCAATNNTLPNSLKLRSSWRMAELAGVSAARLMPATPDRITAPAKASGRLRQQFICIGQGVAQNSAERRLRGEQLNLRPVYPTPAAA